MLWYSRRARDPAGAESTSQYTAALDRPQAQRRDSRRNSRLRLLCLHRAVLRAYDTRERLNCWE